MGLSDVLADAAIALQEGAEWYDDYPPVAPEWVRKAASVLAEAAGAVQDARHDDLPALPEPVGTTTFVGPQLCHPALQGG